MTVGNIPWMELEFNSPSGLVNCPSGLLNCPSGLFNCPLGLFNCASGLVNCHKLIICTEISREYIEIVHNIYI